MHNSSEVAGAVRGHSVCIYCCTSLLHHCHHGIFGSGNPKKFSGYVEKIKAEV